MASAVLRVVFEAEQAAADPRLHLTRTPAGVVLAVTPELAEYAVRLGRQANAIARIRGEKVQPKYSTD